MLPFQVIARRRLADLATKFQLSPYALIESGNGTEYKNFNSETVFTVYHDRLDTENSQGLEIALGIDNAIRELALPVEFGADWFAQLSKTIPQARGKSPQFWPRIGIRSEEDVERFEEAVQALYTATPTASVASTDPTSKNSIQQALPSIDERVLSVILTRRGQPGFRAALLKAYRSTCAFSGCIDHAVLEAAHIVPHAEQEDYRTSNGILLRADIHTLFDLQLISVNPSSGRIAVAPSLSSQYKHFHGMTLQLPVENRDYPDHLALMQHYQSWRARVDA